MDNKEKVVISKGEIPDVNNRMVLKDPILCLQYLQDYVDATLFKNVKPEDIEDMTEKYQAYLGISFESDTVKKIHIRDLSDQDDCGMIYFISLIEHKSQVDYDVSMQLLRYMACIWNEYAKEMKKENKNHLAKDFRYPPIIPVVHYEGTGKWTAAMHLQERIAMYDGMEKYIPNFTYKLVKTQDFSNEELLAKDNEMSLLMMLNKVQTVQDLSNLIRVNREQIETIVRSTTLPIREIIGNVAWNLAMRMNASPSEAEQCVEYFKEANMGSWFENMEKMDIQAERRNTTEAKKELQEYKEQSKEKHCKSIISVCLKMNATKELTMQNLMEECNISISEAEAFLEKYWK